MNASYMAAPFIFLVDSISSLYILAIVLRFLLQWSNADFYNPIAQFLIKITHPPLKLLRRYIPAAGRIDTSAIVLALVLQMLADFTILFLKGIIVSISALTIISFTQLSSLLINIFIFAIFAQALLSWITPGAYNNAATSLLYSLTKPILDVCRKLIPDFGGIDLSPLAALILLQLAKMILLPPLHELANIIG